MFYWDAFYHCMADRDIQFTRIITISHRLCAVSPCMHTSSIFCLSFSFNYLIKMCEFYDFYKQGRYTCSYEITVNLLVEKNACFPDVKIHTLHVFDSLF